MNNNNKKRVWAWFEKRTKQESWKSQGYLWDCWM